jgi:hypothetical protein
MHFFLIVDIPRGTLQHWDANVQLLHLDCSHHPLLSCQVCMINLVYYLQAARWVFTRLHRAALPVINLLSD